MYGADFEFRHVAIWRIGQSRKLSVSRKLLDGFRWKSSCVVTFWYSFSWEYKKRENQNLKKSIFFLKILLIMWSRKKSATWPHDEIQKIGPVHFFLYFFLYWLQKNRMSIAEMVCAQCLQEVMVNRTKIYLSTRYQVAPNLWNFRGPSRAQLLKFKRFLPGKTNFQTYRKFSDFIDF